MTAANVEMHMANLQRAFNPGLVYDTNPKDYIPYLSGLNYSDEQMSKFLQQTTKCTTEKTQAQLNYASFVIQAGERVQKYTRTVTNIGEPRSVYRVKVDVPETVRVSVKPAKLRFTKVNQKMTYEVTFDLSKVPKNTFFEGSITWISESHTVRSPVMATCA